MDVTDLLATLQRLSKDAKVLAFEAGCGDHCELGLGRSPNPATV
jgi:hypothetical protein